MAVGAVVARAGQQLRAGAGGVAQVAEVEGVVGEAALAPARHLRHQPLVPRAQRQPLAGNGEGRGGGAADGQGAHARQG